MICWQIAANLNTPADLADLTQPQIDERADTDERVQAQITAAKAAATDLLAALHDDDQVIVSLSGRVSEDSDDPVAAQTPLDQIVVSIATCKPGP